MRLDSLLYFPTLRIIIMYQELLLKTYLGFESLPKIPHYWHSISIKDDFNLVFVRSEHCFLWDYLRYFWYSIIHIIMNYIHSKLNTWQDHNNGCGGTIYILILVQIKIHTSRVTMCHRKSSHINKNPLINLKNNISKFDAWKGFCALPKPHPFLSLYPTLFSGQKSDHSYDLSQ